MRLQCAVFRGSQGHEELGTSSATQDGKHANPIRQASHDGRYKWRGSTSFILHEPLKRTFDSDFS